MEAEVKTQDSMLSLKELSLQEDKGEQFNIWTNLPIVKRNNLHETLSRREVLVSELQFSIVRKEFFYQRELHGLHSLLRQSIFWKTINPPKYVRRQATFIVARLKRMSEVMLKDLERNYQNEESIVLNLHRLFDLIYKSTSQELASALLAYCDILSELRTMINKYKCDSKDSIEAKRLYCPIEKALVPLQRIAELKSTLLKICDDLRDQRQLAKAHRSLDNVAGVLDRCYECLTCLHGPSYVADIDNILDMCWKPSSLKYRRHRADYLVLPRHQGLLPGELPKLVKPPLPAKNSFFGEEDTKETNNVDALYELVEIPLDYSYTSPSADLLQKTFHYTPLYQAISSRPLEVQTSEISGEEENVCDEMGTQYMRTLWCQIEPVVNSGILGKLTGDERALMETKFEIISSEVSYLKSLCVLMTIFFESLELRKLLTQDDLESLFSNIAQVKEASERFLDDVAYSLSRDVLMSDICSLVRVHAVTTFRTYVVYCAHQLRIHTTFQRLMSGNEEVVEILGQLETSSSCQGYSLISFLTLPLQRVTRLPLLIQAILKRLPDDTSLEHHEATAALKALTQLVNECNEAVSKPDKKPSNSKKRKDSNNKESKRDSISLLKSKEEKTSSD